MLNRSGVTTNTYGNPNQILANVDLQASVGCIVPQSLVPDADANGKKMTVTPSQTLTILGEDDVVGGITFAASKAAKFTPENNTVYVFEYIDTSNSKKYYKVIKVGTPTAIQPAQEPQQGGGGGE